MAEQPAHPNRGFGGKEQVHKNWSGMFERFPDLEVEVLRQSTEGDVVWSEWHWSATGLQMAGVTVIGIREARIFWARLYMEPVEQAGQDIDEAMRTITGKVGGTKSNPALSPAKTP
ncbi:MAG TPA: nuclear transport factor 2 family protein [Rubrobacter sp.]|nr:nuclear transport factor 2 family protein [Rubrobacter sp.]